VKPLGQFLHPRGGDEQAPDREELVAEQHAQEQGEAVEETSVIPLGRHA